MKNINMLKVYKGLGIGLGFASTLVLSWVGTKENEITLAKLVEKKSK